MKSESVRIVEAEIDVTVAKLTRLQKALDLLRGEGTEKKERKPYKKRGPKYPKLDGPNYEPKPGMSKEAFEEKHKNDEWPPKPKKKSKAVVNPPEEEKFVV